MPSAVTSTIRSQERDHSANPRIIITEQEISKECKEHCVLVMGVASLEDRRQDIEFSLSVTQNSVNLRESETR